MCIPYICYYMDKEPIILRNMMDFIKLSTTKASFLESSGFEDFITF